MKKRVISAAVFIAIAGTMVLASSVTRVLLFVICSLLSCWEMKKALSKLELKVQIWAPFAICVVCTYLIISNRAGYAFPVFMIILVALFAQMIMGHSLGVKDVMATLAVCAYPASPLMLLAYIANSELLWAAVLLNSILPAVISDTFALFGGMLFGKHKLAPTISPKKTVEGLISGVIMGTLSGFAVHGILSAFDMCVIPLWAEIIASFLAALAGALGDLAASAFKRESGIKDYSNLIPGHGGMLDRIDSELFAMPVVYMLYALFV